MSTSHSFLFAGLLVGVSVAMPIGPSALLCIGRTLASGMRAGVATGFGAATVNVLHASLILVGLGEAAPMLHELGRGLGVVGGIFLLWTASRIARRRDLALRDGGTPAPHAWPPTPRRC